MRACPGPFAGRTLGSYANVVQTSGCVPPHTLTATLCADTIMCGGLRSCWPRWRGDDHPAGLPHREQIAPGVYAAGFADRYHCANCGWVALKEQTLLIDLPRGIPAPEYVALVASMTGKPVRTLALTNIQEGDGTIIRSLVENGITRVLASLETRTRLLTDGGAVIESKLSGLATRTSIGDAAVSVKFVPLDHTAGPAGAAVWVSSKRVLFAGPLVIHGPRAD